MGLCLDPYGGPREGAVSYERDTPVLEPKDQLDSLLLSSHTGVGVQKCTGWRIQGRDVSVKLMASILQNLES